MGNYASAGRQVVSECIGKASFPVNESAKLEGFGHLSIQNNLSTVFTATRH